MLRYISERSSQGAVAWLAELERAIRRLEARAETFSEALECEHFKIDVKQLLFKTRRGLVYRMVFTITEDEVRVLRVRGPGQAPIDPLETDLPTEE